MLDLALASVFFALFLHMKGQLAPIAKETGHVLHPVVGVEQSSHCIEQILVPMQIFLSFDELELKSSPYRFVLKRVIVLNVVDQFLEQITAVVDLKQSCILLVIGVD